MKIEENQLEGLRSQHEERICQLQETQLTINQVFETNIFECGWKLNCWLIFQLKNEIEKVEKERKQSEQQLIILKENLENTEKALKSADERKQKELLKINETNKSLEILTQEREKSETLLKKLQR